MFGLIKFFYITVASRMNVLAVSPATVKKKHAVSLNQRDL